MKLTEFLYSIRLWLFPYHITIRTRWHLGKWKAPSQRPAALENKPQPSDEEPRT